MKRDISSQMVFNSFFGFPMLSDLWKLKCLITDVQYTPTGASQPHGLTKMQNPSGQYTESSETYSS